jgi:hypothetical protein
MVGGEVEQHNISLTVTLDLLWEISKFIRQAGYLSCKYANRIESRKICFEVTREDDTNRKLLG